MERTYKILRTMGNVSRARTNIRMLAQCLRGMTCRCWISMVNGPSYWQLLFYGPLILYMCLRHDNCLCLLDRVDHELI